MNDAAPMPLETNVAKPQMGNGAVFLLALSSLTSHGEQFAKEIKFAPTWLPQSMLHRSMALRSSEYCAKQVFQSLVAEFTDAKR